MRNEEIAYLAGIIDGEGTISFMRRGENFYPTITIANTSRKLLEWCDMKVGLACTICVKQPRSANHSLSYHIRWRFDAALVVAEMCLPYLIVKKRHAQTLLQWKSVVKRNGRYSPDELKSRNKLIEMIRAQNSRPAWKHAEENSL